MTMQKFITMDLQTGKKVLQTIEASFIQFSDPQFPKVTNLDEALKAEIARAIAKENALTEKLNQEIQKAENAEAAIRALIGNLGDGVSVKSEIDRIMNLIAALTAKVDQHIENTNIHITTQERLDWNKAIADVALKADRARMTEELDKKVATVDLIDSDGKIKTGLLPSIAINSVKTVTSVAAAMQLTIENGDVVIINPDAKEVKTKDTPVTGTFICVDDTQKTFEKKFRQLYSNSDYISKADVEKLIKVETDRADAVEKELAKDITVINGGEDEPGSIQYFVKLEKERAKLAEKDLDDRLKVVEPAVNTLKAGKEVEGSAANFADKALTEAKDYTKQEITKVNSAAETLTNRVSTLENKVGNDQQGLVKDVKDLQTKVNVINGDESQIGSIKKALADAKAYTEQKVNTEKLARETEDQKLSDRIGSLEASEEFKVNLGFAGAEKGDLLAVKANGQSVKATLEEDSRVVGIVVVADGTNSKTAVMGKVGGFTNLTPGASYFLGSNGKITTEIPTGVRQHIVKVGVAISDTELFVNIEEPIEIRA